jgi:hypothetical protein
MSVESKSAFFLRDQSGNTRLVTLPSSSEFRVGRIKVRSSDLVGRRLGETITQSSDGSSWIRVQPTLIGQDGLSDGEEGSHDLTAQQSLASALASSSFDGKTKFSQEKYLRKKHGKYGKELTLLPVSIPLLAEEGLSWQALGVVSRFAAVSSSTPTCVIYEFETAGLVFAHFLMLGPKNIVRLLGSRGANSNKAATALGSSSSDTVVTCQQATADLDTSLPAHDVFVAVDASNPGTCGPEFDQVVETCSHRINPGGRFVVFVRDLQRAVRIQETLRKHTSFVNVTMNEIFFREHQVLDQRTHPVMTAVSNLFEGFIVAAIKVSKRS